MEAVPILVPTCPTPTVHRGRHYFVISNYSLNMGLGIGEFIRSKTFNIGGFDWSIRYYPDGVNRRCKNYISVFVELMTQGAPVWARYSFGILIGQSQTPSWTAASSCLIHQELSKNCTYGCEKFMERTTLEASAELQVLDQIMIQCHILLFKERPLVGLDVPPLELSNDFGELLKSKEEADITFLVKGEAFPAHKVVLIARSPILKALLCGSTMDNGALHITVDEMEPIVFKALLHFMYTDSLMLFDNYSANEQIGHLLRAADRYGMERLKAICEMKLSKDIDVERVITASPLADQHQCNELKQACLSFLASCHTKHNGKGDYNPRV